MLSHGFVEMWFGLPDVKVCALLSAMDCINNIIKFVSGSFVLRVNLFLSQSVAGSEMNWNIMLKANSSEFLQPCHIGNDKTLAFHPLLFLCCLGVVPGALIGFDLLPVRVAAGF